jgi:hypothetical protein
MPADLFNMGKQKTKEECFPAHVFRNQGKKRKRNLGHF